MLQTTEALKTALKASELLNEIGAIFSVEYVGLRHITFKVLKQPSHLGDVIMCFDTGMTKREIRKVIEEDRKVLRDITAAY